MRFLAALVLLAAAAGAATAGPGSTGRVTIRQKLVGRVLYIEGSLSFIRFERLDGTPVTTRQLQNEPLVLALPAGRYRLRSWQRPCDGNCSVLGPPTDRCARRVRVRARRTLHLTIRLSPSAGCRVVTARPR